jgi:bifunctional DNA-binding transcriptional regulator/antitoxin component of YhaV-PrlF toxin-antitoxin module
MGAIQTFETTVFGVREGTVSVKSTIPKEIAAYLDIKPGTVITWRVDYSKSQVSIEKKR